MTDDPVRKTALEGIDRAAQADDLLKPRDDISDYVQRADIAAERAIKRRKAILDRSPQPTEESVREIIERLRDECRMLAAEMADDKEYMAATPVKRMFKWQVAVLLETLLAENKDYREAADAEAREVDCLQAENKALREIAQGYREGGIYCPDTHVPVSRADLAEIYWLCGSGDRKAEMKIEAKVVEMMNNTPMLSTLNAAQEDE